MIVNSGTLIKVVKGKVLVDFNYDIDNVITNSKESVENGLFIPLIGKQHNGNDYIMECSDIKVSLISKEYEYKGEVIKYCLANKICLIEVKDTLKALQALAKYHLSNKDIITIGITGSNGKTTFKDLLTDVLSSSYKVISSYKNMNNHIGVPLTILKIKDEDICILELGMNHKNEIKKLVNICTPNIRVITNIASSHIGNLGSMKNILKAKLEIKSNMKKDDLLILNAANHYLKNVKSKSSIKLSEEDYKVVKNKIFYNDLGYKVNKIPKHNYPYIVMCILIANKLGITYKQIKHKIANFKLPNSRFEVIKIEDKIVINDAYNANLESMISGINEVISLYAGKYKINLILGDIKELGKYSKKYHNQLGKFINEKEEYINKVYLTGDDITYVEEVLKVKHEYVEYSNLTNVLCNNLDKNQVYYFKASNLIGLEKISKQLCDKLNKKNIN